MPSVPRPPYEAHPMEDRMFLRDIHLAQEAHECHVGLGMIAEPNRQPEIGSTPSAGLAAAAFLAASVQPALYQHSAAQAAVLLQASTHPSTTDRTD